MSTRILALAAGVVALLSPVRLPADTIPAEVLDLEVTLYEQESVRITFRPSNPDTGYAVYRRTAAITEPADLANAIRVAFVSGTQPVHFDHPPPGLPYYYAVVAIDRLERGEERFVPGRNRTANPVTVPLERHAPVPLAPEPPIPGRTPLPELLVIPELDTGAPGVAPFPELASPRPLPPELRPVYDSLRRQAVEPPPADPPPPRILRQERMRSDEYAKGREATLARTVTARFARSEWPEAEEELRNLYLVLELPAARARALFYLGQALYFQGRTREAFMSFLLAEPELYEEVQPWLDAILAGGAAAGD